MARAVERGDIPPLEDTHVLADLVVGAMVSRVFLTPGPSSPSPTGEAMVRELRPFLLRALGASPA